MGAVIFDGIVDVIVNVITLKHLVWLQPVTSANAQMNTVTVMVCEGKLDAYLLSSEDAFESLRLANNSDISRRR